MLSFFISFLMFMEVTTSLLLIIVILMQRSKSGGGLGALGGGATEEVFGSSAGNVLTKTTVVLSIFFMINTLTLAVLQGNAIRDRDVSVVESVQDVPALTVPSDAIQEDGDGASVNPTEGSAKVTTGTTPVTAEKVKDGSATTPVPKADSSSTEDQESPAEGSATK